MKSRTTQVLLLEDDPEYVLLMKTFLGEPGDGPRLRVTTAGTLAEGLEALAKGGIDVVLLDLMLPDSRGLETVGAVMAQAPHVPVIVLTGLYDEALALEAVGRGAQDYLVKATFDARLLKRSVAYAIERARLRAELENILANAADSIVVVDSRNIVRYANPAAEGLFGRKAEAMIGEPFGFAVEPRKTSEIRITVPGGGERIAEMRVSPLQWKRYEAFLASIRDITALRRIEQIKAEIRERRRMDQLKDELMSTVSHELRSPLTVIKAAIANLYEGFAGPVEESQMKLIALAHRNVERLAKIINNLLDLSRLESDQMRVEKETVDLGALAREAVQSYQLASGEKGVRVDLRLPVDLPAVFADPDLVTQVLNNLLDNAVRFAHSSVTVSAEAVPSLAGPPGGGGGRAKAAVADRPGVRITVADDGRGIPPDQRGQLFNKFVQVGRPPGGGGYKGTGLGLAICKEIVTRHDGRIWVESEVGRGARFHMVLPQAAGEQPARHASKEGLQADGR
ncbi:MAG: response regulator [Elusimicrobia bacterium]|nr:response regulator [Elusimicrobiota bacterium]